MHPSPRPVVCRIFLLVIIFLAGIPPAGALLNLDGTRNQVFVFGGLSYTYDSNLFAEAGGPDDYWITTHIGAELQRRAGIITVNATAKLSFLRYGEFTDEDALNPNFIIELTKINGRTTGSLKINIYRESRSDTAVNLRTSSWNFPATLNLRYPIHEKFYVTSESAYMQRSYEDNEDLVDYTDVSEAVDLYYKYTSKLDLLAGYRIRVSETSVDGRTIDHWFNLGATGEIYSKLSGTLRFGYQFRDITQSGGEKFEHFNAQGSVNWPITRKILLTFQLGRDFNTIATGGSVDSTSVALTAGYVYSRRTEINATLSAGRNDFLQESTPRVDNFTSLEAGIRYRLTDNLQMGANFTFLKNNSTFSQADYDSHGVTLDISGRY